MVAFSPRRLALAAALAAIAIPTTATAQLKGSPGYEFLQAVRDAKGDDVIRILNKPGTRIIDTRDPSTGEGALHIVAKRGDMKYLAYLLQQGADPNLRDNGGNTALIYAARGGYDELVSTLLKVKANPNAVNSDGDMPLMLAVLRRDVAMARDLLDGGADPDKADRAGRTVRDVVTENAARDRAMAQLFIDHPKKEHKAVSGPEL